MEWQTYRVIPRKDKSFVYKPPFETTGIVNPAHTSFYGKWEKDWEDMGALEKVFTILNIGQYMSANVAKALLDGDGDLAGAIWRGITLKERGDFIDILKEHGVPWAPLLGTALDIALDPFTWLPGPITIFKKAANTLGFGEALTKATKFLDDINPLNKFKALFDPSANMNKSVFNTVQLAMYGMRADRVEALNEWNKLREFIVKNFGEEELKKIPFYKITAPQNPESWKKYAGVMRRFDEVTKRAVESGAVSEAFIKKYFQDGYNTYVPQVLYGYVLDIWKPGKSLMGPGKKPGFAFERTLFKKNPELFIPEMKKVSEALETLSKARNLEELRGKTRGIIETLHKENPFRGELLDFVEGAIEDFSGDMRKLRKFLYDQSIYYRPIEDITDLGKLYEFQLIQVEWANRLKDTVFKSKESLEGNWAPLFSSKEPHTQRHILASKRDVEKLITRLKEVSNKAAKEASESKLIFKTVKTSDGYAIEAYNKAGAFVGKVGLRDIGTIGEKKAYETFGLEVLKEFEGQDIHVELLQEAAKMTKGWKSAAYLSATDENLVKELTEKLVAAETEEAPGRYLIRTKSELKKVKGGPWNAFQVMQALSSWVKSNPSVFADMKKMDYPLAKKIVEGLEALGIPNEVLYSVEPEVARALYRSASLFEPRSPELNALLRLYDKAIGHWAKWATVMRLPFHMRNFLSNTALAFLGGVEPWEMARDAVLAAKIQKGGDDIIEIAGMKLTASQWLHEMDSFGIRGTGMVGRIAKATDVDEVLSLYLGARKTGKTLPGKVLGKAYEVATTAGAAIEDNARIMTAINRLRKNGGDLKDAAIHVWKYLFQYDQLTDFEKTYMKRLIPFYTWMRKNIPLQVETLITNPGRQAQLVKYYEMVATLNPETPDEVKFKPEYMRDYAYFKLPEMPKKWFEKLSGKKMDYDVYVNIDLPWNAWVDIQDPLNTLLRSLSPVAVAWRINANVAAFPEPDTPIERFKGELKPVPWPMMHLPEAVWPLLGMRPMRDRKTGRMIVGAPAKAVHAAFSAVPGLYELTQMFPQAKVYLEPEDAPWRKLSYLTGVKLTPYTIHEERYWWELNRKNKLREAAKLASQLGRNLTVDELKELLKD